LPAGLGHNGGHRVMVSETWPAPAPSRAAGPGQSGNPGPALAHPSGLQPDVGGALGRRSSIWVGCCRRHGAVFTSQEGRSSPEWRNGRWQQGSAWRPVTARRATPYADASGSPNLMTYRTGRPVGLPGMDAEDALGYESSW